MNQYRILAILGLLAVLAALAPVYAALPGYQQYDIPATVDELKNYIYAIVGNVTITGSNGVFTISDVADNQSSVILLNPAFAYRIEGSGLVGLAYANGTVAVNFSLAQGPVEIISHELFYPANKTASDAPYPAIIVPDGGQASVKIVVELLPSAVVGLSYPAPPFEGTVWTGYTDPSKGSGFIAERSVGQCGQLRVAFWEAHHNSDVDLRIFRDGNWVMTLLADGGRWETWTSRDAGSYTLKVYQYGSWTTERQPWAAVYQCSGGGGGGEPGNPTNTPQPQPTHTPPPPTQTENPSAKFPAISKDDAKPLLIGAGAAVIIILIALAVARR